MASLQSIMNPLQNQMPASWQGYQPALQFGDTQTDMGLQVGKGLHDWQQYALPDLLSSYGSRGTFHSGARQRGVQRAGENVGFSLMDLLRRGGMDLADLQTGTVGGLIGMGGV